MFRVFALVSAVSLLAVGCGPTCQSTCSKLYGTTGDACAIKRAGGHNTMERCMDECKGAIATPGDLDGYSPDAYTGSYYSVKIENEKQAAAWMDCIAEMSCDNLRDNACAPIW